MEECEEDEDNKQKKKRCIFISEIICFLLTYNIDLEISDIYGNRAIHFLCSRNNLPIVAFKELINKVDLECVGFNNNRPIHLICKFQNRTVLDLLLSKGVNGNCVNNDGKKPFDLLKENENFNIKENSFLDCFFNLFSCFC